MKFKKLFFQKNQLSLELYLETLDNILLLNRY